MNKIKIIRFFIVLIAGILIISEQIWSQNETDDIKFISHNFEMYFKKYNFFICYINLNINLILVIFVTFY